MPPSSQPPGTTPPALPNNSGPVVSPPQHGAYEFIVNPEKPPRRPSFSLPGSPIVRVVYIAGTFLVLLIVFNIIKGQVGKSNFTPYVGIAQEQQEMIHLVTNAGQQTNLSAATQNFAATAQLSLTSSRDATAQYLANNHQKINAKVINLKVSTAVDDQLTNAATAGTYDQSFQTIMKSRLTTYVSDLKQTYQQTKGQRGHALLNDDYNQAQLLLIQLNLASSQPQ